MSRLPSANKASAVAAFDASCARAADGANASAAMTSAVLIPRTPPVYFRWFGASSVVAGLGRTRGGGLCAFGATDDGDEGADDGSADGRIATDDGSAEGVTARDDDAATDEGAAMGPAASARRECFTTSTVAPTLIATATATKATTQRAPRFGTAGGFGGRSDAAPEAERRASRERSP